MSKRGFCGCCSLRAGAIFTALLCLVYNGALIYWFFSSVKKIHSADDFYLVLTVLLAVLMFLAVVHIAISLVLIYAAIKNKPDLVMLWIIIIISSCIVVASLFTVGLAFILNKVFLFIILCNFIFILNIIMTLRLYNEMVENSMKVSV